MTTAPELPLADATAMTRFHRIFREALDSAPRFIGGAPSDDVHRADLVGSYYANVLKLLHAHHEAEDLTIYPLMVERLPEHVDAITRVNAEHEAVLGTLVTTEETVTAWCAQPSDASRDRAVAALEGLRTVLLEHLDHEEAEVVPLIALCINVAEWGEMSGVAFQHFSGDKVWLAIGLIQEQLLVEENETMEANMPPPCTTSGCRPGARCSSGTSRSCATDSGGAQVVPRAGAQGRGTRWTGLSIDTSRAGA